MIKNLLLKSRSYRKYDANTDISYDILKNLVNLTRYSPTAANLQPLKFIISCTKEKNPLIFPHLSWAGYLKNWHGPEKGERPAAYIIVLGDTEITEDFGCDHGIAAQSILLGAAEIGLGGCIIGAVNRQRLRKALDISFQYRILLVIALGKPMETVIIEPLPEDGNIRYWRSNDGAHHVPKRSLDEIIISENS